MSSSASGNAALARLVSLTIALPYDDLAGQMAAQAPALPPHQIAARIYALRRKRDALLPADLFGEPAWDMLLDLFVQQSQGRRVSVTSLCIASGAPQSTALSYITLLETAGLIERANCANDQRVAYLTIAQHVFVRLGAFMADSLQRMTGAEAG